MTNTLAYRIAFSRKKLGISQRSLAKELDVTHSAVQKWENGENSPDSNNLTKMADLFGVSTDWLLGRDVLKDHHDCKQYLLGEQDRSRLAAIISVAANQMDKLNSLSLAN